MAEQRTIDLPHPAPLGASVTYSIDDLGAIEAVLRLHGLQIATVEIDRRGALTGQLSTGGRLGLLSILNSEKAIEISRVG